MPNNFTDFHFKEVDNQREHSWILRNVLRKGSSDKCKRMNWGEVRYGDSIRYSTSIIKNRSLLE